MKKITKRKILSMLRRCIFVHAGICCIAGFTFVSGKVHAVQAAAKKAATGNVRVTFLTVPDRAEVFIDGKSVGLTPLVELAVEPGTRRLFINHSGYEPIQKNIDVPESGELTVDERLGSDFARIVPSLHLGFQAAKPINTNLSSGQMVNLGVGAGYKWLYVGTDVGLSFGFMQDFKYPSVTGSIFNQERQLKLTQYSVYFDYRPFYSAKFLSPYIGVLAAYSRFTDYLVLPSSDTLNLQQGERYAYGIRAGVEVLPQSTFRIFVDVRYQRFAQPIYRETPTTGIITGAALSGSEALSMDAISVNVGVRLASQ